MFGRNSWRRRWWSDSIGGEVAVKRSCCQRPYPLSILTLFCFSSRRRHTRYWRDWVQTCALPISIPPVAIVSSRRYLQDMFGKYLLDDTIATGGMGEVLRATYCPEGGFVRVVAVKRIRADRSEERRVGEAWTSRTTAPHADDHIRW